MKISERRRLLLAGAGLALSGAALRSLAAPREIPFATGEWPPFVSLKAPKQGLLCELLTAVLAKMGARPKFIFTSWPRAEAMVERGLAFAAFPYARTAERAARFDFSDTLMITRTVLFYHRWSGRSPIVYRQVDDLKRYRVGGTYGYFYEALFQRHGIRMEYASSELEALKLLLNGRVDVVPLEETVGWYLIQQSLPRQAAEFGTLDTPLADAVTNHLIISRRYPDNAGLRIAFNQALAQLRASGKVERILHRYQQPAG